MWREQGGCGVEELVGVGRRLQWIRLVLNTKNRGYLRNFEAYRQRSVPIEMPLLLV
jgi:hypothetical protein